MKKSLISLLSTLLALLMLGGILCSSLAACTTAEETTAPIGSTEGESTTQDTETTSKNNVNTTEVDNTPEETDSVVEGEVSSSEGESDSISGESATVEFTSDTEVNETTDEDTAGGKEEVTEDFVGPTLEKDGQFADSIKYSQSMLNGVQSYYTESARDNYRVENLNMNLLYSLKGGKKVTAITNKQGGV